MRLPLGLIGCGAMGRRHIRGLAALAGVGLLDFELAAVSDLDEAAALRAAEDAEALLGQRPRVVDSLEAMLREDIVALDIATAPASHHVIAVPALQAGLHVLCEKPLSITLRGCAAILDAAAAAPPGTVLAVQEQHRRGPANRIARAVIESGMLGEIFFVSTLYAGGDDRILLTPWRHQREQGSIALDNGVHFADVQHYLLGTVFESVWGRGFIAEPVRRRGAVEMAAPEGPSAPTDSQVATAMYEEALAASPETIVATGEDSIVAMYRMLDGVSAATTWLPSGPGHVYRERTVHGRGGSMVVPPDRSGADLQVRLANGTLGAEQVLAELPAIELDEATRRLFPSAVYADRPFAQIDAAHLGVTLWDLGRAILDSRPPEVDGVAGTDAVAAILGAIESGQAGRAVSRAELLDGHVDAAQRPIDVSLGLA